MQKLSILRPAFTMVELIFAIVVLGIVSSIGAEIIAKTYESHIVQRAQFRANNKTELALNQIANRLRYAIPSTIVSRPNLAGITTDIEDITNPNMRVLQWVGYDGDSFEAISSAADRNPGWSGFCDLDASTATGISTPGSNLDLSNTIINNLGGDLLGSRLYFIDGSNPAGYPIAGRAGKSTIILSGTGVTGDRISERYKLAWSSYALEIDSNNDLILHYNFTPAAGAAIDGSSSLLLHNVTNFRFKSSGGAFRLKICKTERIGMETDATIHACKEKVVF